MKHRAEQRWVNHALLHTTTNKYLAFVALCTWRNNFSYFSMFGDTNLLLWCFIKYNKLNYHTAFCTRLYHHALYRQIRHKAIYFDCNISLQFHAVSFPLYFAFTSLRRHKFPFYFITLSLHLIIHCSNNFQCYNKNLSIHTLSCFVSNIPFSPIV